ncbi:MAG: hypothetical protein H6923_05975 [Alphaproteobacteria bacterium]|nr:hypothetical protein [Alphaproteobacteria bacterium]
MTISFNMRAATRAGLAGAALVAVLSAGASGAEETAKAENACLRVRDIRETTNIDETRILARGQGNKPYLITLANPCPELNFDPPLTFDSRSVEMFQCLRSGDVIKVPTDLVCFIDTIEEIDEERAKALVKKDKSGE